MKPVILRRATAADMDLIRQWHREQNERDGTYYPLGLRFNRGGALDGTLHVSTPLALVGEEDGEPKGSLYCERTVELQFAGCDPKMTAFSRRDIDAAVQVLYWQGYRTLHCSVPLALVNSISAPLAASGFVQTDHRLAHFFKDLEG